MLHKSEKASFLGLFLSGTLLLSVCLTVSVAYGGKDVSLSEVPKAVRATMDSELKGAEINDIERDRDDGKIVYEVDADGDDGREIKLKIAKDGTLLRKREEIEWKDMPPAVLDAVKKSVGDIDFDDIEKRSYPGRRTVYKIEGDTDDLEIDLEIAPDGTILDKDVKHKDDEDDLTGSFRRVRRMFLQLRGQLKVAAIGDSRVEKGIDPKYFLGEQNRKYPMAFNFGGASRLTMAKFLVENYFIHGPRMEWVVYGVSTRIFNRYYRSRDDRDNIKRSPIYRRDKAQWATLPVSSELVPAAAVDDDDSPWGFDGNDGIDDDFEDDDERDDVLDDLRKGRYKFDTKRLELFESMIQTLAKHNIRMLAFSPPIHPISIGQPCTDDDGTTREAYDEFVKKMNAFDEKYPNFYFLDVNKKGEHNLEHKEFNDFDHLNIQGARKLTLMLNDFMKKVEAAAKSPAEKNVTHK